jgi:hypothetical protein
MWSRSSKKGNSLYLRIGEIVEVRRKEEVEDAAAFISEVLD